MTSTNPHFQRAWMLLQQNRPQLAEQELRQALIQQSDNGEFHAVLALALSAQNRHEDANREAQEAIGLAPDDGFPHYVHSRVLTAANCFPEAEKAIQQALEADSSSASYFAQLAAILVHQKRWDEALAATSEGLELDPKDASCINLQSMALVGLGQGLRAAGELEDALQEDPEDAWTHANLGWTLLEAGKTSTALEHFKEALRLEPNLEHARVGIVTAMKSQFFLYRPLLNYFLWVQKLQSKYQMVFILGFYFLMQGLQSFAKANPAWEPWVWPILGCYLVFVYSSWLGNTLFNMVLSLNRFGRLVLSAEEKWTSLIVGVLLLISAAFFVASFWFPVMLFASIATLLATLPLSLVLKAENGWPRWAIAGMGALLLGMGICPMMLVALVDILPNALLEPLAQLTKASISGLSYAAIGSQIGSQLLINRSPRRLNPKRF